MELAKRKTSRFWTVSLPSQWSMRKIWFSPRYLRSSCCSASAEVRSWPNGFSMMMRDQGLSLTLRINEVFFFEFFADEWGSNWAASRGRKCGCLWCRGDGRDPLGADSVSHTLLHRGIPTYGSRDGLQNASRAIRQSAACAKTF